MKNAIYSEAIAAYKNGIITLSELFAYLKEYGLESNFKSALVA